MVILLGKMFGVALAFGLVIRTFPEVSGALAIGAIFTLYWVMRHHFKTKKTATDTRTP